MGGRPGGGAARIAAAAALVGALACAAACSDRPATPEGAVRAYVDGLVLAYRTGDYRGLVAAATEPERGRVVVLRDLKSSNGLVLECTVEQLEVRQVQAASQAAAVVETTERWRYFDRAVKPGIAVGAELRVEMDLRYDVVHQDGAWRVNGVQALRQQELGPGDGEAGAR